MSPADFCCVAPECRRSNVWPRNVYGVIKRGKKGYILGGFYREKD